MLSVDYLALELKRRNLRLWTFPGGTIAPLYDACRQHGVETIVARSEQGAGYMALGAAKATRAPQVVAVTSGPGATNLISTLADAFYDGVPLVALTGQVGTAALAETRATGKRQSGFQETPIVDIARPITILAAQAHSPDALAALFPVAFHKAEYSRRSGPVLIDMPMDVQRAELATAPRVSDFAGTKLYPKTDDVHALRDLLEHSKRPIILAGAGCLSAVDLLREFASVTNIPVVSSLPAVGILPTDHPLWRGLIGHTGHPSANRAVQEADLVLVLGARLDLRQTGSEVGRFAPQAKIARVDSSGTELAHSRVRVDLPVLADCAETLNSLLDYLLPVFEPLPQVSRRPAENDHVGHIIEAISDGTPGSRVFTTGVGSHQQHAARWLRLDYPHRMFITSAGHGCMGAGLPLAIGASLATGKKAIVIDGDGSFQMTMNELGTIARYGLQDQIDIHIIDNGSGGIVSQFARLQGWQPEETSWRAGNPRFETIASAYPRKDGAGGLGVSVHRVEQEGVWPIMEGGHTLDDMTDEAGHAMTSEAS